MDVFLVYNMAIAEYQSNTSCMHYFWVAFPALSHGFLFHPSGWLPVSFTLQQLPALKQFQCLYLVTAWNTEKEMRFDEEFWLQKACKYFMEAVYTTVPKEHYMPSVKFPESFERAGVNLDVKKPWTIDFKASLVQIALNSPHTHLKYKKQSFSKIVWESCVILTKSLHLTKCELFGFFPNLLLLQISHTLLFKEKWKKKHSEQATSALFCSPLKHFSFWAEHSFSSQKPSQTISYVWNSSNTLLCEAFLFPLNLHWVKTVTCAIQVQKLSCS